ncbi:Mitochondrial distribution and morphology protein 12 [Hypoxylon texense]
MPPPVTHHANIIHAGMSGAEAANLIAANTDAIQLSNAAGTAYRAGRYDEAILLHQQALELKLKAYPETSIQAAISLNGLGEALLGAGRLQEADDAFAKAIAVRERAGPVLDAAATRENIGALREAQGRFGEAREVRVKGNKKKQILCGNYNCPTNKMHALRGLQACGNCKSVFYCTKECQKQDWVKRHRPLCQAHCAKAQTSNTSNTSNQQAAEETG